MPRADRDGVVTEATLEDDPRLAEIFGPNPVFVILEAVHRQLRWERVRARWESKHWSREVYS